MNVYPNKLITDVVQDPIPRDKILPNKKKNNFNPLKIENILTPLAKKNKLLMKLAYLVTSVTIGIFTLGMVHLFLHWKNRKVTNKTSQNERKPMENKTLNQSISEIKDKTKTEKKAEKEILKSKLQIPTKTENLGIGEYPSFLSEKVDTITHKTDFNPITNRKICKYATPIIAASAVGAAAVTGTGVVPALAIGAAGAATIAGAGHVLNVGSEAIAKLGIPGVNVENARSTLVAGSLGAVAIAGFGLLPGLAVGVAGAAAIAKFGEQTLPYGVIGTVGAAAIAGLGWMTGVPVAAGLAAATLANSDKMPFYKKLNVLPLTRALPPSTKSLEIKMGHPQAKVGEWGDVEACYLCKDSVEGTDLKFELLKQAKQEILISGSYCGGLVFDKFLLEIEKALSDPEKPDLKVRILSNTEFMTNLNGARNWTLVNRLTEKFPERFQVVITPQLKGSFPQEEGQDFKWVGNHSKFCIFDRRYLVIGGSGIEDRWATVRADEEIKDVEELPTSNWRSWVAKGFRDADVCLYSTKENSPVLAATKEFYKILSWYDCYNHGNEISTHCKVSEITNSREASVRLDSDSTVKEKCSLIKKAEEEILIADRFVGGKGFSQILDEIKAQLGKKGKLRVSILCGTKFISNSNGLNHWKKINDLTSLYPERFRLEISHVKGSKENPFAKEYPKVMIVDGKRAIVGGSMLDKKSVIIDERKLDFMEKADMDQCRENFSKTILSWNHYNENIAPISHPKQLELNQIRLTTLNKYSKDAIRQITSMLRAANNEIIVSGHNIHSDDLDLLMLECEDALDKNKALNVKFMLSPQHINTENYKTTYNSLILLAKKFPDRFDMMISNNSKGEKIDLELQNHVQVILVDKKIAVLGGNNNEKPKIISDKVQILEIQKGISSTFDFWKNFNSTSSNIPFPQKILNKLKIEDNPEWKKIENLEKKLIKTATKEILINDSFVDGKKLKDLLMLIDSQMSRNKELNACVLSTSLFVTDKFDLNNWKLIKELSLKYFDRFRFIIKPKEILKGVDYLIDEEYSSIVVDGNRLLKLNSFSKRVDHEYLENIGSDVNVEEKIKNERTNLFDQIDLLNKTPIKNHPRMKEIDFNFTNKKCDWRNMTIEPVKDRSSIVKTAYKEVNFDKFLQEFDPNKKTILLPGYQSLCQEQYNKNKLEFYAKNQKTLKEFVNATKEQEITIEWPESMLNLMARNRRKDYPFFDSEFFNYQDRKLKDFFTPLNKNNLLGLLPDIKDKNILEGNEACKAKLLVSSAQHTHSSLTRELCHYISKAKKSIHINHMYFQPNPKVYNEIKAALERGVEVHLVTNGKQENCPRGHNFFGPRNRYNYKKINAFKHYPNFHVYEWNIPRVTNHKKFVLVDKKKFIFGSSNMSYKGLTSQSDIEMNMVIKSATLANEVYKDFQKIGRAHV